MAQFDRRGLPLSTSSSEAARLYRDGVDLMLSAWPGAVEMLKQATGADPEFGLAHAALARLHAIRAEQGEAKARIDAAIGLVSRNGTERERSHVATLSYAVTGQSKPALESTLSHVQSWPRDAIILSLPLGAFGLFAFSGMADHDQARVDLCESVASHFEANDWWFLTYRGWSHAENGNVAYGRDLAERGLTLRRANANAAHALSHAMFEGGATDEAEGLVKAWLPIYDRSGTLHGHIAWHAALSALARDDAVEALKIYEAYVQPSVSQGMPINIMTDAVSLLWRLRAYGFSVPQRLWDDAKAYSDARFPNAGFSFADAHMGLLSAATADKATAERRIAALEKLVEEGTLAAGEVVPAICRAALSFIDGDYSGCVRLLEPLSRDVARIGGSGAQRDVIEDTLVLALMRSGEVKKARALLDRRLHRRPSTRDSRWMAGLR